MDALMTLTTESQRVDDVSHQMETQIFSRVNSVKSSRNIALGNLPKLGKDLLLLLRIHYILHQLGDLIVVNWCSGVAVEDTRKKMKMAEAKILQLTKKNFQFRTANNSIHQKLDELRNKILRAKQAASSVSFFSIQLIHGLRLKWTPMNFCLSNSILDSSFSFG